MNAEQFVYFNVALREKTAGCRLLGRMIFDLEPASPERSALAYASMALVSEIFRERQEVAEACAPWFEPPR